MKAFGLALALLPVSLLTMVWSIHKKSATSSSVTAPPTRPPLNIFLMVGQSNMQGHGYIDAMEKSTGTFRNGTLEWMVQTDPKEYGKLKTNGEWTNRSDVWIAYNSQRIGNVRAEMNMHGPLTAGYGGDPGQFHMGPELGFGWTMGDFLNHGNNNAQTLLLKVAWGGRSLAKEFRPPSSGGETGLYYEAVIANTFKTLSRLEELFPEYASIGAYQIVGFVWHQGWNDLVCKNCSAEYEFNLANLIRDIRSDLGIPHLPVSIGISGMTGWNETAKHPQSMEVINAQFAVADGNKYPEFSRTVKAVETRDFWVPEYPNGSPGGQGYHWSNNCESYWNVGKAMAQGMISMLKAQNDGEHSMQGPWHSHIDTALV